MTEQETIPDLSANEQSAQINPANDNNQTNVRIRLTKLQREQRRATIAERVLSGVAQVRIARELGMTESVVCKEVQFIEQRWVEQAGDLIERKKARYEAKLRRLECKLNEYLARSEEETKGQPNPRYVELLQAVLDRFAKLYGLAQEGAGQASAVTVVAGIDLAAVLGQRPALVDMQPRPALEVNLEPEVNLVATNEDDLEDDYEEDEATPAKPKRPRKEKQPTYSERLGLGSVFDGLSPKKRGPNHPDNNQPIPPEPAPEPIPNPHPEYPKDITTTEPDSQAWQDHANQAIHNLD